MPTPPSPHFTPVALAGRYNARRDQLPAGLRLADPARYGHGVQVIQGLPFDLSLPDQDNVILLENDGVAIATPGLRATYLIFLHQAEDQAPAQEPLPELGPTGNAAGHHVADYALEFEDGTTAGVSIRRRFAIQQAHIRWGASPFEAVPAAAPRVLRSASDAQALGQVAAGSWGWCETGTSAGRDAAQEHLWLYALPNPFPDRPIQRIVCTPGGERAALYAITSTQLTDHPLRPGVRQRLRLALPPATRLNPLGGLDELALDLGTVITAAGELRYDPDHWRSAVPNAQPVRSETDVIVDYVAHPAARLFVGAELTDRVVHHLAAPDLSRVVPLPPPSRPVRLSLIDRASRQPTPARLHLHGPAGEYLAPRGYPRHVNPHWFEDNYAGFVNGHNQYAYVPGEVVVDLPVGEVAIEIAHGYEYAPVRTHFHVQPDTEALVFELTRVLPWRAAGWVTADTHVHFLSPHTALLEGAAEGVNVVNLLASQWGEMFSNVGDFDGQTTLGARELGGSGEFLVRVGTENRTQVMGHISLLGYSGPMIHPLCTGGPTESALGDALDVSLADWARQCIAQGGLVVMPHAPDPQAERAADIVLGLVHALELMSFNPFDSQLSAAGLADWYQHLSLGHHLPVVGGSDKMAATMLLGGLRTYAHLGGHDLSYANWQRAIRAGNTFATVGPLVTMNVDGCLPGGVLHLPASGGTVSVNWVVESAVLPVEAVEVVVGGYAVDQHRSEPSGAPGPQRLQGATRLPVKQSTWIAVRVRGSYRGLPDDIAAHTSAVQVLVAGSPLFAPAAAGTMLDQIAGVMAYVESLAPFRESTQHARISRTLREAHARLHAQWQAHAPHGGA